MKIERFTPKYRKLNSDLRTERWISEADPGESIRLVFEVRKTEEELDEWKEVTHIYTKLNLGDSMYVTATTTVGMLEVFEEDDSVLRYEIHSVHAI